MTHPPIDGMLMLPQVFTSVEAARELIKAKDYPEFAPETDTPEG